MYSWKRMMKVPMATGPSEVSYVPLSPKDAAMEFHWERHKECDGTVIRIRTEDVFKCLKCKCIMEVTNQGIIEVYVDDDKKS